MNILKIQIEKNSIVEDIKQMSYCNEDEFFTALVTLCDELGVDVPLWTTYEERILQKEGQLIIEAEKGSIIRISSYSE